jgi:excisionase family DNA binding protein
MEQKELPDILTLKQASEVLHCHPNTLRTWEREGLIRCIRFGKRGDRRFPKEEIVRLLEGKIKLTK